jgi:hypothetical protein
VRAGEVAETVAQFVQRDGLWWEAAPYGLAVEGVN